MELGHRSIWFCASDGKINMASLVPDHRETDQYISGTTVLLQHKPREERSFKAQSHQGALRETTDW